MSRPTPIPTPQPVPFDRRRTTRQKALLAASVATIVLCFGGGIALLVAKHLFEQRTVTAKIADSPHTAGGTLPPAADSTAPAATDPAAPGVTSGGASEQPSTQPPAVVDKTSRNFLLAASDDGACVDPNSPWSNAASKDRPDTSRSDTIMILRLDAAHNRVAALSFPRDLWVEVPGKGSRRINTAYAKNQPDRLIQTIKNNFGIRVDHYVQVNFCAFKQVVDAVGGVDIPFKTPIQDIEHTNLNIKQPGCHHFVGDEALAYARSRHLKQFVDGKWKVDPTSDFGRIARQQDLIGRVLERALGKGLLSPSTMTGLLKTLLNGNLVVSAELSIDRMVEFGTALRSVKPDEMGKYQVKTTTRKIGSALVEIYNPQAKNMTKILQIFRGEAELGSVANEMQTNLYARILPDPDTKC